MPSLTSCIFGVHMLLYTRDSWSKIMMQTIRLILQISIMYRKIISASNRYYSSEKLKKIDYPVPRPIKGVFNKLFLSHIRPEEDGCWIVKLKNSSQFVAYHPSNLFSVAILRESDFDATGVVYAISINPIKNWLVQERKRVVMFKDSNLATNFLKIIDEQKENILELSPNGNFLSEILSKVRPTGHIINAVNLNIPPILVGELNTQSDKTVFTPNHKGFPNLNIPPDAKLKDKSIVNGYATKEVFCEMIQWEYGRQAVGRLLSSCPINFNQNAFINSEEIVLKLNFNLDQEIQKLLHSFDLKDEPFSTTIINSLKMELNDLQIGKKEKKKRESFLDKCVVSIDPVDAKDLDDALHITSCPNGDFEVGIHIADVSHYVRPNTPVDKEAVTRASSIYLVHKAIPMLPGLLSEDLCSLNPNVEKLTFSVVFIIDSMGTVISERFVKGIIKPTMRLNYDEASKMIDGDVEMLPIKDHPKFNEVMKSVKKLDKIAKILRKRRIDNGAFVLEKVVLRFSLDPIDSSSENNDTTNNEIALPSSFRAKESGSSNYLIEEWMLMANQAAARLVHKHIVTFPESATDIGAVLRYHPPPDNKQKGEWINASKASGIMIKHADAGELQPIISSLKLTDPLRSLGLSYLCYFNMQLAMYCCAETLLTSSNRKPTSGMSPFHHFGLNVPLYTHFTSPIRRYADVLVHRQIDAIIHSKPSTGTPANVREVAVNNSNIKRHSIRRMQDRLSSLYMAAYLNREGWKLVKGLILREMKNMLTILLPFSGIIIRTDLMHFAPWACEVARSRITKDIRSPATFRLKYLADESKYRIETINGFTQYVHKWHEMTSAQNNEEIDEQVTLDDLIDAKMANMEERCALSALQNNTNERLETSSDVVEENYLSCDVKICETVDCILCCSDVKLELVCQMPYPGLLAQFKEDSSRQL